MTAPSPEDLAEEARRFCAARLEPRVERRRGGWGEGSDTIVVIEEVDPEEEQRVLAGARAWRRQLHEHGLDWITGPPDLGGRGLQPAHAEAVRSELARWKTPEETPLAIGLEIVGPAIDIHGTLEARAEVLGGIHRGDVVACQLFSEPDAGSDLSAVRTTGQRVEGGWVVSGQKVWTSGAHLSDYGEALVRTDPDGPRHRNLTMMLVDMHQPGVEVRPLRQMTGGASFNEVFLREAFVPDHLVLGEVEGGWDVAMTTLLQERLSVGAGRTSPATHAVTRLWELVDHLGAGVDPHVRQRLAGIVARDCISRWFMARIAASADGPGPEMSIAKLQFTSLLSDIADLAAEVLGPSLTADTDAWGTFAWSQFVTGAPGMHIAGGTSTIQRNILAERVLGLPR